MEFSEAVANLTNPNDKYDLDLIAMRIVMLELLKRTEKAYEPKDFVVEVPIKKSRKKSED